jgi:hypothetical protein
VGILDFEWHPWTVDFIYIVLWVCCYLHGHSYSGDFIQWANFIQWHRKFCIQWRFCGIVGVPLIYSGKFGGGQFVL